MKTVSFLKFLILLTGLSYPLNAEPLHVVASFTILKDFIEKVGQEHVHVESIVGPNEDPHVYEPTPQTSKQIVKADIVFFNGLGFETWMSRLVEASGYQGPQVIATEGIQPRTVHDPSFKDATQVPDPHAWNAVSKAKIYVKNIRDALIKQDPDNQKSYQKNAAAYLKELDDLEAWVRKGLSCIPQKKREIITAHDAFGYYGDAYGIKILAPVGISTEAEASAWDIAKLVDQIRALKIKVIFVENISNTKVMQQLSEETGSEIGGTLYSDSLSPPAGPAATYNKMIRHNTNLIIEAMKKNDL